MQGPSSWFERGPCRRIVGMWNGGMDELVRHPQPKERATDRLGLNRRDRLPGLMRTGLPGSESRAKAQLRFPRNVGGPAVSTQNPEGVTGALQQKPPALGGARHAEGSEASVPWLVPPNQGNQVRRDGRPGVAAPDSTVEAGEPAPAGTLWREAGVE